MTTANHTSVKTRLAGWVGEGRGAGVSAEGVGALESPLLLDATGLSGGDEQVQVNDGEDSRSLS